MAASLAGTFNTQQFTDAGKPLVGGRLYTFAYGTSVFKSAYKDFAGLIPHTYTTDALGGQYIGLNSRGELTAPLYLLTGSYDIRLCRADGSIVWTRRADPIADSLLGSFGAGQIGFDYAQSYGFGSVGRWLKDLVATPGANLIGYLASGAGSVLRTVQSKQRDTKSVLDYGAGTAGFPVAMSLGGGSYRIPAGEYIYSASLVADYSDPTFPDYMNQSKRVSLIGDALHSTFLNYAGAAGSYALTLKGPDSIANLGVYSQSLYQDFVLQDSGHTRTRNGISLTNTAFAEFRRMNVSYFNIGCYINSSLSTKFDNFVLTYCNTGIVIDTTTGQANPNSLSFDCLELNACSTIGIAGNLAGSTNRFVSPRIEQCGTPGLAGSGGMSLSIDGSNGPASLVIESGYFEGNAGLGSDLNITNVSAHQLTVVLIGCTFNRISSTRFTAVNVSLNNIGPAPGSIRCVFIGCAFFSGGTYVPNPARPFFTCDARSQFIDGGGNSFSETTSKTLGFSGSSTNSGRVNAAGAVVSAAVGINAFKISTGVYSVSSFLPFGKTTMDYAVTVNSTVAFDAIARAEPITASSFTVRMQNPSTLTPIDGDFSFQVNAIK